MILKRGLWVISALILSVGASAFAQQPDPPASQPGSTTVERQRNRTRHGRLRREHRMLRAERLGLTDAQRQQLRALHQQRFEALKLEREELLRLREKRRAGTFSEADGARAKQLREQMREARKSIRNDVKGILTDQQRAQIEELRKARRERREEMRKRRQEIREAKP